MRKYKLTEEHKKELVNYKDFWIKNAMSTKQMDEEEKKICIDSVTGLYESAGIKAPPVERIIFVQSPFVARFVAGFSSAIWYLRKNKATDAAAYDAINDAAYYATNAATRAAAYDAINDAAYDAINDATRAATDDATHAATDDATHAAAYDAINDATRAATDDAINDAAYDATDDATHAAAYDAINDATRAAAYDAINDATCDAAHDATFPSADSDSLKKWYCLPMDFVELSKNLKVFKFGLMCSVESWKMYDGGNHCSAWVSFLSFFKDIAKLDLDYSKYIHYENLCKHSGPRYMHKEFCIISDRPKTLLVNSRNQPHNFDGPFCEWRDGSKLFSFNGVMVPAYLAYKKREEFKKEDIVNETNADIRREIIRKIGIEKTIELLGSKTSDKKTIKLESGQELLYELILVDVGDKINRPYLKMENPSMKGVFHIEGVHPDSKTIDEALSFRNGTKELPKSIS
jgi:hypothetical protein